MNSLIDPRPVVVAVDESDSACDAVAWATGPAAAWRAPLHLVHVVNRPRAPTTNSYPPFLQRLGVTAEHAGAVTTLDVLSGALSDQLLARARDARLLVLGSYGSGGWSGMLAGTNALAIAAGCPCPLVVARGPRPGTPPPREGPVVVGIDGSSADDRVLDFAARTATTHLRHELIAVHTWSDVDKAQTGALRRSDASWAELSNQGTELVEQRLRRVAHEHPELSVSLRVLRDAPLRALLGFAENAWLLVTGSRRTVTEPEMLDSSTSRGLIEFAPCPVAVVPPVLDRDAELAATGTHSEGQSR